MNMNGLNASPKALVDVVIKNNFSLKPVRKDGLVVQIHHTIKLSKNCQKRLRFLYTAFDNSGLIVANADIGGNIFVVDLSTSKYWSLPKLDSCSILSFSPLEKDELLCGSNIGDLYIININSGGLIATFEGHNAPVKNITYNNEQCLTASASQAIIFNLRNYSKVHELAIGSPATLKHMFFMPVTNHILACFSDDYIHVWKSGTFESYKKLLPTEWHKFFLRGIAVTRNGTTMVLGGLAPKLIVFSLDSWQLTKILNLPDEITVRSADFISQPHDGGANKFLVLLASNGIIHFLDMERSYVVSKIQSISEITSFCSSLNGMHLACVLKSGEVNIYKLSYYISTANQNADNAATSNEIKQIRKGPKLHIPVVTKNKEELNIEKLQGILKEYGEYPESYRALIWSKVLSLPRNHKNFAAIVHKGYNKIFDSLDKKYPLVNKAVHKSLKNLLSNLGNWCPDFCQIEFLPFFVFPFVKIFENDPIICFEAVITILINWCQFWFEYAPCPPINTLAMIENILSEHDPLLLAFFFDKNITSLIYAWQMLESAFSEVLTIKEWCILWDHILSNEPSFMLMVPVSYCILCRSVLIQLKSVDDFKLFFRNQNAVGIKKIVSKSYALLQNTSEKNHPRKYLEYFHKLPEGPYPVFDNCSKIYLNIERPNDLKKLEDEVLDIKVEIEKYKCEDKVSSELIKMQEAENKRLQVLEDIYQEKLLEEKKLINQRKLELSKLRTDLLDLQAESLEVSRKKMEEINFEDKKRELEKMIQTLQYNELEDDIELQQTEEHLSKHYIELLKQKSVLENMLLQSTNDAGIVPERYKNIDDKRKKIQTELEEVKKNILQSRIRNKVQIPIEVAIASAVTQNIDMALAKNIGAQACTTSKSQGNMKLMQMEHDTQRLEEDVENLLQKFTKAKIKEANYLLQQMECPNSPQSISVSKSTTLQTKDSQNKPQRTRLTKKKTKKK